MAPGVAIGCDAEKIRFSGAPWCFSEVLWPAGPIDLLATQAGVHRRLLYTVFRARQSVRMTTVRHTESRAADHDALRRRRVVWMTLLVAMTGVGGLLAALQGEKSPRLDGVALAAAIPAEGPRDSINSIFNTRAPLESGKWLGIVIHDSGSSTGSAASIAAEHEARGLLGLGHHYIIGNGRGADDGELYVGYRWLDQLPGAHAAGPDQDTYNRRYIGICLVGDGDRKPFTDAQMARLVELVGALTTELGIPARNVVLHRDIAATTSPGRFFSEATLRRALSTGSMARR